MLTAIIVAAGNSRRMGFDKLLAEIAGQPVIAHAIAAFEDAVAVTAIVIVARADRHGEIKEVVRNQKFQKIHAVVKGGEHRQDSVRAGLENLPESARYVAVHDAARPLVTAEQIARVYELAQKRGATALAAPVSDTLKRADDDLIVNGSVDRHQLFAMQTPQIFERELIEEAYHRVFADTIEVTDEVSAIERIGGEIALVANEQPNFKITYPGDLPLAEFVLNQRSKSG
jgi:2-C-methyl-D-erythritol 4-phosphate cytidylyltransferase